LLQLDDVLERSVVAFDFALGHGMIGSATNVFDMLAFEELLEFLG
jgi:hypothetical protein